MYLDGNDIYLCGKFQNAGSLTNVNNIAKYNISSKLWQKVGDGANDTITAITKQGNDLYLGGYFSVVSGVSAMSVVKYSIDSNKYVPLGSGIKYGLSTAIISDIAIYKNELYISGKFTSAGKSMASNLAKWSKIPVEVKENSDNRISGFECYPNPASDILNIKINSDEAQKIIVEIYNQLSQKVISKEINYENYEFEINTKNLESGIYFVKIGIGNVIYSKKVIIIK